MSEKPPSPFWQSRPMQILRWVAVLPVAFAAYAAMPYLSNHLFNAVWLRVDLAVISFGNLIFCEILAPLAFLFAGIFVAPRHRPKVAVGLTILYAVLTVILYAQEIFRRTHSPPHFLAPSLGLVTCTAVAPLGIIILACIFFTRRRSSAVS